jgi:hypothetical protein
MSTKAEFEPCKLCKGEMQVLGKMVEEDAYILQCKSCRHILHVNEKKTETIYVSRKE